MKRFASFFLALGLLASPLMAQNTNVPLTPANAVGQPNQQPDADPALLSQLLVAKAPRLLYRTDDIITVQIVGIENYSAKQRVSENGTIDFPLIGLLQVAGLTTEELQISIEHALASAGMIMHAQVTVISDSRPSQVASVLGDVVHPGTFPATGNLTVVDYISQAQGFVESVPGAQSSSAANYTVTLIRPGLEQQVRIPLGPGKGDLRWGSIPIFAGDQIRVDKIGLIYAVGAFKIQGSYQLKNTNNTMVSQLVALAGGIGYEADTKDSHIVRRRGDQTTVIDLNVGRILRGKDPDMALEAEDILFVPTNQLKAALKGGGSAIIVSLASAALYRN